MKMTMTIGIAVLVTLLLATGARAGSDSQAMNVNLGVGTVAYWAGGFEGVTLSDFTFPTDRPESSSTQTFVTNGDVSITADNSDAAQLKDGEKTLTTEYRLTFDADGNGTETGAPDTDYEDFSSFLSSPALVNARQTDADGAVQITLHVRASGNGNTLPESGNYSAVQTLTVTW